MVADEVTWSGGKLVHKNVIDKVNSKIEKGALASAASLLIAVAGCADSAASRNSSELINFQILSRGADPGGEFCGDFNLTSSQAEWFFSRAKVLDAQQLHDHFDHLPCWVRGTALSNQGIWQWEVRAGGTARLTSPEGVVRLLGCDECDAVLIGTESPPAR